MTPNKTTILTAATAAACLWPLTAAAQQAADDGTAALIDKAFRAKPQLGYTSQVEVGAGYNSEDSFKFGEFSGLEDDGAFAIGNATVRGMADYDSGSTMYWEGTGTDLGLDSRSIHLEYGHQGRFGLFFDFDQIPRNQIDDGRTPFSGVGDAVLILPPGLKQSSNLASTMTELNPSLRGVEIETDRTNLGGGFTWHLTEEWSVKGSFAHEVKEGTDTIAGIFGSSGGNPGGIILPEPIDYETDKAEVALGYTGKRFQAELGYSGSWFTDNNDALIWDNPFSAKPTPFGSPWQGDTSRGRLGLPPDNQAHQVTLSGGYNMGETTRLTGAVSYGKMLQDADFLPYTINSGLVVNTPLPRSSLDGEIENWLVMLAGSTRPLPKLDLQGRYRYHNRDNNTPRDTYLVVPGDSANQDTTADDTARINLPLSFEQHQVNLDAGYRILPSTKVTVGYDLEAMERTLSEVDTTYDHTGRVKVQSTPFDMVSGRVEYAHTIRDGTSYDDDAPFDASHTAEYLATTDPNVGGRRGFENHPDLRKFTFADRNTDAVSAAVSIMPTDVVSFGVNGGYTRHDYDESRFGVTDQRIASVTVDATYTPRYDVTAYVFFTHERQMIEQRGIEFSSSTTLSDLLTGTDSLWSVDTMDRVNTAGGRVEWKVIKDRLDLSAEYTFSRADTEYDLSGGSALTFEPLPDIESKLHSVGVAANYHIQDNMALKFGYRFEKLTTKDFALDGVEPDTMDGLITLGESSPDYVAHVVGVSFAYSF